MEKSIAEKSNPFTPGYNVTICYFLGGNEPCLVLLGENSELF